MTETMGSLELDEAAPDQHIATEDESSLALLEGNWDFDSLPDPNPDLLQEYADELEMQHCTN